MLTVIWSVFLLASLTLYFHQVYSRFRRYGVKYSVPMPLLGNMGRIALRLSHIADDTMGLYNAFPGERFVGRFVFLNPVVMIKDIELIKKITIKDFEHFLDHPVLVDERLDPLFGRNLFTLKGQEWKEMRTTLSPAFTSSKMRVMIPFMLEVSEQMIKSVKKKLQDSGDNYIDVDCKDLTTRYTNDVIASCAFGLKVDSLSDQNNKFYKMGKIAATFTFTQSLKFFLLSSWPAFTKIFRITLFTKSTTEFFKKLVISTMKERKAKQIVRPDLMHLLMEVKKGKLSHEEKGIIDTDAGFATVEESSVGSKIVSRVWTDNDIVAQAVIFFIAGFEGIAGVMSCALYEIALHPDVQERLFKEIKENDAKNGGCFDYNSIQSMTYLDMVLSEVLRIWPPGVTLDRQCMKDYNLGKPNREALQDYIVRKDESIIIPVWAIHHDPEYHPDPEKFDPERFSEENKHQIKPLTYIPFGLGPRNCIGSRFALCEVKVMLYQLLLHIEVSPCEKTSIPAKLSPDTMNIRMRGGHWLRFQPRK